MNEVSSRFIGKFKVGDNINYNLGTLRTLCLLQGEGLGCGRAILGRACGLWRLCIVDNEI